MQFASSWRYSVRMVFAILACATVSIGIQAQSAGNPKGTTTPAETPAPKGGSSPTPASPINSGVERGKLVGNEAQARARMQSSVPLGSGTEGGLSSKRQGAANGNPGGQSDKGSAYPKPVPPTR